MKDDKKKSTKWFEILAVIILVLIITFDFGKVLYVFSDDLFGPQMGDIILFNQEPSNNVENFKQSNPDKVNNIEQAVLLDNFFEVKVTATLIPKLTKNLSDKNINFKNTNDTNDIKCVLDSNYMRKTKGSLFLITKLKTQSNSDWQTQWLGGKTSEENSCEPGDSLQVKTDDLNRLLTAAGSQVIDEHRVWGVPTSQSYITLYQP